MLNSLHFHKSQRTKEEMVNTRKAQRQQKRRSEEARAELDHQRPPFTQLSANNHRSKASDADAGMHISASVSSAASDGPKIPCCFTQHEAEPLTRQIWDCAMLATLRGTERAARAHVIAMVNQCITYIDDTSKTTLHGSFAIGTSISTSDVDLLIFTHRLDMIELLSHRLRSEGFEVTIRRGKFGSKIKATFPTTLIPFDTNMCTMPVGITHIVVDIGVVRERHLFDAKERQCEELHRVLSNDGVATTLVFFLKRYIASRGIGPDVISSYALTLVVVAFCQEAYREDPLLMQNDEFSCGSALQGFLSFFAESGRFDPTKYILRPVTHSLLKTLLARKSVTSKFGIVLCAADTEPMHRRGIWRVEDTFMALNLPPAQELPSVTENSYHIHLFRIECTKLLEALTASSGSVHLRDTLLPPNTHDTHDRPEAQPPSEPASMPSLCHG